MVSLGYFLSSEEFTPKELVQQARFVLGVGFISTGPDADLVRAIRDNGGGKPAQGGMKACWAPDDAHVLPRFTHAGAGRSAR